LSSSAAFAPLIDLIEHESRLVRTRPWPVGGGVYYALLRMDGQTVNAVTAMPATRRQIYRGYSHEIAIFSLKISPSPRMPSSRVSFTLLPYSRCRDTIFRSCCGRWRVHGAVDLGHGRFGNDGLLI
jgi:hypothetical protein